MMILKEIVSKMKEKANYDNFEYLSQNISNLELGALVYTPNKNSKEYVMLTGTIHGDEPIGSNLVNLIDELDNKKNQIIVPVCNPTGYENKIRFNHELLDINRDFQDLKTKEAQFINKLINKYDPSIIDFHQSSVGYNFAIMEGYKKILEVFEIKNNFDKIFNFENLSRISRIKNGIKFSDFYSKKMNQKARDIISDAIVEFRPNDGKPLLLNAWQKTNNKNNFYVCFELSKMINEELIYDILIKIVYDGLVRN